MLEGTQLFTGTLEDGHTRAEWMCLADGCYELQASGGLADSEIGFRFALPSSMSQDDHRRELLTSFNSAPRTVSTQPLRAAAGTIPSWLEQRGGRRLSSTVASYSELTAAIADAADIEITEDIGFSSQITIAAGVSVTLWSVSSAVLDAAQGSRFFYVDRGGLGMVGASVT